MRLIGRVCVSEAAGLGQSRGSSCLPAACTGNRVCHFLGSTLDHDGGGGSVFQSEGIKNKIEISPDLRSVRLCCTIKAEFHQGFSDTGLENLKENL